MGYSVDELLEEIENLEKEQVDTTNIQQERDKKVKQQMIERKTTLAKIKKRIFKVIHYALILSMFYSVGSKVYENSDFVIYEDYENNIERLDETEREMAYTELSEITGVTISEDSLLILEGAVENANLTDEEKAIVYGFTDLITDNPYLDRKEAYKSLRNVDIIYPDRGDNVPESTLGTYNYIEELIRIFEDNQNRDTTIHELIHCLYTNKKTAGLPNYLGEGMAELLSNEYFSSTPFIELGSYPFEIVMVKQLCEMVGSDAVLKAYSTGDMDIILDELSKTISREESEQFLTNVKLVFDDYRKNSCLTTKDYMNVLDYIDKYYEATTPLLKIPTPEEIEREKLYHYYRDILKLMAKDDSTVQYYYYLIDNGIEAKPYFSKKLLALYPNETSILYEDSKDFTSNAKTKKRNIS